MAISSEKLDEEVSILVREFLHRRVSRTVMYLLLLLSAGFSVFAPSQLLLEESSDTLAKVWSGLFALAALLCLIGSLLDRWMFEYVAIPLLGATLLMFGVALLSSAISRETGMVIPYSMFFGAFSFGLFARWRDVQCILRVSVSLARCDDNNNNNVAVGGRTV